jgi:hypothetical protein
MKHDKILIFSIVALLAFNLTLIGFFPDSHPVKIYGGSFLSIITSAFAAIYLFRTVCVFKSFDRVKLSWLLIAVTLLLDFIAETGYTIQRLVYNLDMNELYPSVFDYVWLLAYAPSIVGFSMIISGYKRSGLPMGNMKSYGLLVFCFSILVFLVAYFLLIPIWNDTSLTALERFFYIVFPIVDLILVVLVITLLYQVKHFGKGAITTTWLFMIAGLILFTFADLIYSYLTWLDTYELGSIVDVAWNVGYLSIALSGSNQYLLIKRIQEGGRK